MLRRSFIPLLAALAMTILSVSAMPAHGTGSTLKTYSQTYQVAAQGAVTVICPQIETGPDNWTSSWHGIQDVTEQFIKLQYYRFYVLPLGGRLRRIAPESRTALEVPSRHPRIS